MRSATALLAAVFLAGAAAPSASAHPNLVRTEPGSGTVLGRAPSEVRVVFDTAVRPASGIRAVRNGRGSVLRSAPHMTSSSHVLVIPLRRNLRAGDYTVRWRIRSDDGHVISGVMAFGVGSGRPPPSPALSAGSGGPAGAAVVRRVVFFSGVLLAVGGVAFLGLVVGPWRLGAVVPLAGFGLALAGSQPDATPSGRFEHLNNLGAVAALAGAAICAAMLVRPGGRLLAFLPPLGLLAVPTFRGHALDPGQVVPLAVAADLVHLASAAFWVGGLAQLALLLALEKQPRRSTVRRFSAGALVAVLLVGATGLVRAFGELSGVEQLWRTGYGRVLLVKTALLAGLVALAWANRGRLRSARPLGRGVAAELVVLVGLVTAVALLTELRPGRHSSLAVSDPSSRSSALRLPPRGAVVLARQSGSYAVALAARRAGRGVDLLVSVLGPDQLGVNGLAVRFQAGRALVPAEPCGGGCYSARLTGRPERIALLHGRARTQFELPPLRPLPASTLVARAARAWRSLRTLVLHERLASGPRNAISSVFEFQAPDRMAYRIRGGPAGIVIGSTRWDRASPRARWVRSPQDRLRQPEPFWTSVSNAYVLERAKDAWVVSFLDRAIPAWFMATIDRRTYRTHVLRMTAAAHFMHHRYGPFNGPVSIRPPG